MGSPQVEDGFTKIANELLDAIIRSPFSKRQYKVLLHLIRKTYGFGKKSDDMTVTQIANATGLTRPHASGTLHELIELNTVLKRDGRHGYVLTLNKNYRQWGCPETGHRPKTGRTPSQNGTHNKQSPKERNIYAGARAKQWPGSDEVPVEWIEEATAKYGEEVDWKAEGTRFVNHHTSKGNTFKDWKRAWWTWCNSPYPKRPGKRRNKVAV